MFIGVMIITLRLAKVKRFYSNFCLYFLKKICYTLREERRCDTMDFQKITQEKYLQYFLSDCEHSISDTEMMDFLNDMISLSEQMDMTVPPTEIIKEIIKRCGLEGSVIDNIRLIATSNLLETLNTLEVFTFLWYVSCRNTLTYEEGLYLNMANNKTIGNLIKRLSKLYA
jgi:hypothetical protein